MKLDLMSLRQILLKIKLGKLRCIEVCEHFANNIEKHSNLNSIIYYDRKHVLEEANKLDKLMQSGKSTGRIPKDDAPIIRVLRNEGALFMAKANLHELCFGVTSDNGKFGTCKNSKNENYFPGGSTRRSNNRRRI